MTETSSVEKHEATSTNYSPRVLYCVVTSGQLMCAVARRKMEAVFTAALLVCFLVAPGKRYAALDT